MDLLGDNIDFDETTATWNNAPGGAGGTVGTNLSSVSYVANDTTRSSSFSELHTFGDTAAFRTALQSALGSDATIRFMLKAHDESQNIQNFTRIDSDEAVTPANNHTPYRPALTIDYTVITPLPSAATAGLVLMGGFGLRRARRRG